MLDKKPVHPYDAFRLADAGTVIFLPTVLGL
jgi:hypothetical protein